MAQVYKGPRDVSTFALPQELKARIKEAGARHGYAKPGVYLADLIGALHPDPDSDPEMFTSMRSVIPTLLRAAQASASDKEVATFRTPKGVKPRIKAAFTEYGYADMTAYLVDLMSALHPARGGIYSAAHKLVSRLLRGQSIDDSSEEDAGGQVQQSLLDLRQVQRTQQTAA